MGYLTPHEGLTDTDAGEETVTIQKTLGHARSSITGGHLHRQHEQ